MHQYPEDQAQWRDKDQGIKQYRNRITMRKSSPDV